MFFVQEGLSRCTKGENEQGEKGFLSSNLENQWFKTKSECIKAESKHRNAKTTDNTKRKREKKEEREKQRRERKKKKKRNDL